MSDSADIFIGTMSGTSMDGLDLVAVKFGPHIPQLLHQKTAPYPDGLRYDLQKAALDSRTSIDEMCALDTRLGRFYARQINAFIEQHALERNSIRAIGSHGQTLRHTPYGKTPYTLQIGDANIIAALCDITVVADFRRRDLALGGQGAPLTPAFHHQVFHSDKNDRVIINIGGIANLTLLPKDPQQDVIGFDSGPGNTLMDAYCQQNLQQHFDDRGSLASNGKTNLPILSNLLDDPYFRLPPPKSTGTDYFSPAWMKHSDINRLSPPDALATLTELTAISIRDATQTLPGKVCEYFICGGGAHNDFLLKRLTALLSPASVKSTAMLGIHPDRVEATAFAWLARQTLLQQPGNLASVTNAKYSSIIGAVHFVNGHNQILC